MRQSQQEFLLESMEYLGLTKNALAIKLNTSEYTINSWLLPENRPGFVELSEFIHDKISNLVQEKKSANFFRIHTGTFEESFVGRYCDKYQFRFPTLYRTTSHKKHTDESAEVTTTISYSLSNLTEPEEHITKIEALPHLQAGIDNAWVFINEHSSMNAVLGYWRAISNANPETVSARFKLFLFEDHLFSIYHRDKPENALINNIVMYQIDDNEFQIAMPTIRRMPFDDWSLIVDEEGNERVKTDIWK